MSCTDNETFCLKLRETMDTTVHLWCASVKAFIEIFEENKKKTFSDNCYYQKRYFYRKPLNQWLKLGLQVPKNPRHCKRHNWGPAQFKPLPQYSHNSAPFDDQSLKFNSSVRFVKNVYVSTMRENGLNALLLHFIHKGIALDCNAIIDDFAKRNQKRMSFISDSSMPRSDWFSVIFGGCNNMNKGNDAVDSCLSLLLRFPFGNRLWEKALTVAQKHSRNTISSIFSNVNFLWGGVQGREASFFLLE